MNVKEEINALSEAEAKKVLSQVLLNIASFGPCNLLYGSCCPYRDLCGEKQSHCRGMWFSDAALEAKR